jgi:hypothetical protein
MLAYAQGRPSRAAEAERQAAELEPMVSYLTIGIEHAVPGLVVRRGNTEVGDSAFGVELPVDPGTHTISASAPGYEDWSTTITIGGASERRTLEIPSLTEVVGESVPVVPLASRPRSPDPAPTPVSPPDPASAPVPPPEPDPGAPAGATSLGPSFWIATGTSLAAAAVTGVFGVMSLNSYSEAKDACPERIECGPRAMELRDRADDRADVANLALGTTVVAAVVASVLYLMSDEGSPEAHEVGYRVIW